MKFLDDMIKELERKTSDVGCYKINSLMKEFEKNPEKVMRYLLLVSWNMHNDPAESYKPLVADSGILRFT